MRNVKKVWDTIHPAILTIFTLCINFFHTRIIPILIFLSFIGVSLILQHLHHVSTKLLESMALEGTAAYCQMIEAVRTLYTSEVVERVRPYGIEAAHDYAFRSKSIPLPATFTIMLGHQTKAQESGVEVRLYSDLPFPWRKDGGARDKFEKDALAQLRKNPDRPFFHFENYNGEFSLRYAKADRMRASCVACHNSHPQSPKTNWKEGDVRGILEVIRPLHKASMQTRAEFKQTAIVMTIVGLLGLSGLLLVMSRLRRISVELERKVQSRTEDLEKTLQHLKQAQSHLVQSEKMSAIGQLAAGLAHEINNPLGVILGFAQGLKSRLKPGEESIPIAYIEKEAIRCKDLVANLLTFSRTSDTGGKKEIDINVAVEETFSLVETQSKFKGVELVKKLDKNLPMIFANNIQIQQIIINLCNNALDAMSNNGRLTIKTGQVHQAGVPGVFLEISDTGAGIPPDIQNKIFDPFFTTKEVGKGTGLGLSLVYEIVKKHGGNIDVKSEPDRGSTFIVFFPLQNS